MKKRTQMGKDAKNKQIQPKDVKNILTSHREALIITADTVLNSEGESKIEVFSKLLDNHSVLVPMLTSILRNLLTTNDKQCGHITGKASVSA